MTRRKADEVRLVRVAGPRASKAITIRVGSPAHVMLTVMAASVPAHYGIAAGDLGPAAWPNRKSRGVSNGGGGDYAAQMLLGRMKAAGLVEHAPSEGSTLWRITLAGRNVNARLHGAV